MYFVSSMILMRMNIPQEYREILNRLLGEGDIDFQFFHRWFDEVFLASAFVSTGALWTADKMARTNANKGLRFEPEKDV